MRRDYRVVGARCPGCGTLNDGATKVLGSEGAPDQGDFSVCVYCSAILCFTYGGGLRFATEDDMRKAGPELALRVLDAAGFIATQRAAGKTPRRPG